MRTVGRKNFPPYSVIDERAAARMWRQAVVRGPCVMCRASRPSKQIARDVGFDLRRLEGHHVLPKRQLKVCGRRDALWDARNGLCVCGWHHARHENHVQRIPRAVLPVDVFEFAAELDLSWLLDREYPEAA